MNNNHPWQYSLHQLTDLVIPLSLLSLQSIELQDTASFGFKLESKRATLCLQS